MIRLTALIALIALLGFFALMVTSNNAHAQIVGTNDAGIPLVAGNASLSWDASLTPNVTYNVYDQAIKLNQSPVIGLTYLLPIIAADYGRTLVLHVKAVDQFGIESKPSNTQSIVPVPNQIVLPPSMFKIVITFVPITSSPTN